MGRIERNDGMFGWILHTDKNNIKCDGCAIELKPADFYFNPRRKRFRCRSCLIKEQAMGNEENFNITEIIKELKQK